MENELRLGNLFILRGKIVEFDDKLMHSVIYGGLEGSEPIPLTEEWLLKFGFYNSEVFKNSFIKNGVDIYIQDTAFWYDLANDSIEIKTIHHLQNLYFALTNEELTMK